MFCMNWEKQNKTLNMGSMSNALGPARIVALPLFVALTVSDRTSGFKERSNEIFFLSLEKVSIRTDRCLLLSNATTLPDAQ